MEKILVELLRSILYSLSFLIPLFYYLNKKIFTNTFYICNIVFSFIYFALSFFPHFIGSIYLFIYLFFILVFVMKQGIKNSIIIELIVVFSILLGEFIYFYFVFILLSIGTDTIYKPKFIIINYCVILLVSLLVLFIIKKIIIILKNVDYLLIKKIIPYIFIALILLTIVIIIILLNILVKTDVSLSSYFYIVFVIFFIELFLILAYLKANSIEKIKKQEEYEQLKFYTHTIEALTKDIRKKEHDYKNTLVALNGYIENSDFEGMKEYFYSHIVKPSSEKSNSFYLQLNNLKEYGVKGLLASKLNSANELGLNVDLQVLGKIEIPEYINKLDLFRIIGILMDNAIEAAKETEGKKLSVVIMENNDNIEFTFANDCNNLPDINKIYKDGYSTKGKNRGIGLSNVKEIVNKNKYLKINTSFHECMFMQELTVKI